MIGEKGVALAFGLDCTGWRRALVEPDPLAPLPLSLPAVWGEGGDFPVGQETKDEVGSDMIRRQGI